MYRLVGCAVSEGIAQGAAHVHHPAHPSPVRKPAADVPSELDRWRAAMARAKQELAALQHHASATLGEEAAGILGAQLLMLDDPDLLDAVSGQIHAGAGAEVAWTEQVERYAAMLAALDSPYLRERAADVRDVGNRVSSILAGVEENSLAELACPAIVIGVELTPCDTVTMNRDMAMGFATARGGTTSHVAILARGMGLPAVVGVGDKLLEIVRPGDFVIVDGFTGEVFVDPDAATRAEYERRRLEGEANLERVRAAATEPAVTRDGRWVRVAANIADLESCRLALDWGAEEVGLLRTEFLFLNRNTMPNEEEQTAAYSAIFQAMGDRPVVVRTLDVGGDKLLSCWDLPAEPNPFLGLRAIRLSLAHPDVFGVQLRAILRAGVARNVKLLLPMVAMVDEVIAARSLLEQAKHDLRGRGRPFAENIEVGIMVEVPSTAICASLFTPHVDFFSIGTNDLTQYVLAADRTNERVGYMYDPLHPAVLRVIKNVIDDAHQAGKWVGMCGEMAADPDAVPLLLGFGLDEFSVNGPQIAATKALIRTLDSGQCLHLADRALQLSTAAEIRELARSPGS